MKFRGSWSNPRTIRAFTLVEIMIALVIFFMAVFSVLSLLSNTLRNARALQRKTVDGGMVAAEVYCELTTTNKFNEGEAPWPLGDMFPDNEATIVIQPFHNGVTIITNGLYQVDIIVVSHGGATIESQMAILVWNGIPSQGTAR